MNTTNDPDASSPAKSTSARGQLGAHTVALRVIATILIFAASSLLKSIVVPFALALILAVAFSPLADWMERRKIPRAVSSLFCTLIMAVGLAGTAILVASQVGSILQDSDRYLDQLGKTFSHLAEATGADQFLAVTEAAGAGEPTATGATEAPAASPEGAGQVDLKGVIQRNIQTLARWATTGLGGLLGLFGGAVIFLAFLYFMLSTRTEWVDRIKSASRSLGFRPKTHELERIRDQIATYIRCLMIVSACYAVVISLALWALGVPKPLLWGLLTALLEVIPYFGPVIAGAMPALFALGSGGEPWQPIAVVALFAVLQTVEGYVIAPLFYGKAVELDPVTVILGVLFFGFVWGPFGLALAMPTMILLRGLLAMSPDTPALDALMDNPGEQDSE